MGQVLSELDPRLSAVAAFGAELRDRRLRAQRSLDELGRTVLVSGSLLGKVEKGLRRPQADLVQRLDEALCAEGRLLRLAAAFVDEIDFDRLVVPADFSPELAQQLLRAVIDRVRAADHSMAADSLDELLRYARASQPAASRLAPVARTSLLRTVAEALQLAGWILFDRGQCGAAERMFTRARKTAERVRALDLLAYVGGPNLAFMSTWSGSPDIGAEQAYGALAWAYRSGNRRLTAFVATMAARAHARLGEGQLCERMLSGAESDLAQHDSPAQDPSWLAVFDAAALVGHRGSCMLDLGKPGQAVRELEQQGNAGPVSFVRNNTIWRLEWALANLRLRNVDVAAAGIDQTLTSIEDKPITPRVVHLVRSVDAQLRTMSGADSEFAATRDRLREFIEVCA